MSGRGPLRVVEWNLLAFRRVWMSSIVSSFVQPLLYLLGMGLGVGALVARNPTSAAVFGEVSYAQFIAPALLATTAMMVGAIETMFPVFGGFKWIRVFHAMAATPLSPIDIVLGHLLWIGTRIVLASGSVAVAMALVPSTRTASLPLAVIASVLCGTAFAMPLAAYAASVELERGFIAFSRFGLTPMLLFAGTFFPVSQLPSAIRPLAYVTPVWHGVELCRGITLGTLRVGPALLHVGYLLAFTVVGTVVSFRRFAAKLAA
jgi:lipooligosaccharide transport system permease protein